MKLLPLPRTGRHLEPEGDSTRQVLSEPLNGRGGGIMALSSGSDIGRGDMKTAVAAVLRRVRFREAIYNATMDFFRNTTLHGFRDLADRSIHWLDRLLLAVCLLTFTVWSLDLILLAWAAYTLNPIYTSLSSTDYPVAEVPFPGIAICPNNKLSRSATLNYARFLSNKTRGAVSQDVFMEQLRYLGRLLDFEVDGYDNFAWLQSYLNMYDVDDSSVWYDTYSRMRRLSPKCEDILLNCNWEGVERDCHELFDLRATQEGFCCTFNYVRSDAAFHYKGEGEAIKTRFYGIDSGLQLVLNVSQSDYYYPLMNNYGHSVLVFQPHDYPDTATGYLEQRFIKPSIETLVELFPRTLEATESLRFFRPEQRNCLFRDERPGYNGFYSQSECLLNCRIRTFVALCDCIPFFIPRTSRNAVVLNDTQTCNLEHVSCLNKYQTKMRTYSPTTGNIAGLEKERQDSMDCGECLPLCNHVNYYVGTVSISMHSGSVEELRKAKKLGQNDRNDTLPVVAVVKIYHAQRRSSLYVQDVVSEWFNMLSSYGGQIGLCIGFSLLSFFEFAYFFTWRLWREVERLYAKVWDKRNKQKRIQPFQTIQLNVRPFYNKDTDRYFLR